MQALILAGGKGTRLRPLTVYTPKPIVPVANRPFLMYQIDQLKAAGITDITLSLSYQPDKIELLLGNGSEFGVNLRYLTEPSPMGTAGAYKFAEDALKQTTLVFNGDILSDVSIAAIIEQHSLRSAAATITLVPVADPSRYGVVTTDSDSRVKQFIEKPSADDAKKLGTSNINAGIYVLEPEILDLIPKDTNRSFEYEVFPAILEKRLPFYAYVIDKDYWLDIGTPENYLQAHHDILAGRMQSFDRSAVVDMSEIATHAEIDRNSIVGESCVIKPGARIVNSVLGAGVQVEERAVIENSVVWSHTRIAAAAEIRKAVIGRSCHIGRNATVSAGTVLGDKSTLTDYTKV